MPPPPSPILILFRVGEQVPPLPPLTGVEVGGGGGLGAMALQKFNAQDKRKKKEKKDEICLFLKIMSKSITKLDSLARIFTEILPHMACLAPTKFLVHYATYCPHLWRPWTQ